MRPEREWLNDSWEETEAFLDSGCLSLDGCQRRQIRLRWLEEARHYDNLWRKTRSRDYGLRIPLLMLGAAVPALAVLNANKYVTAGVSLAVAVLTALDQMFNFGARWRQLRRTAALLKQEGWAYLELTGPYLEFKERDHTGAYRTFLNRLEGLNAAHSETYQGLFKEQRRPAASQPPDDPT